MDGLRFMILQVASLGSIRVGIMAPGEHDIAWDGRTQDGRRAAFGRVFRINTNWA